MFRYRIAAVAVAAGLGLACGCSSLSSHSFFSRFQRHTVSEGDCVDIDEGPGSALPIADDGPILPPPRLMAPPQGLAPQATPPDLTQPPDRLTPVPNAPRQEYKPMTKNNTRGRLEATKAEKQN